MKISDVLNETTNTSSIVGEPYIGRVKQIDCDGDEEKFQLPKGLKDSKEANKLFMKSGVKFKKDHRGINYDPESGILSFI